MLGGRSKIKDKLLEKNLNESDEQFIFYDYHKEKKFQQQIEIQAVLNSNNSFKVMVIIDKKSTLDYLCIKIGEQMEKFEDFANLEGLKATNITKKIEKGLVKIPSSGDIKDHIMDGDVLSCDLTTHEYWVKTNIKIFSNYSKMMINLDLKFRLETFFKNLKFLLIKLGINFWIDYTKGQEDSFHYTFATAKFKTIKSKNNFELNINDLNKTMHIESVKIKDVFDFHSEINCQVHLISLEELLFNELKSIPIEADSMNKLRWNEFKEMSFDMFYSDRKFQPEQEFIKKYIRKLLRSSSEKAQKSFYVYNKNCSGGSEFNNALEEDEMINNIETETANLIIGPENKVIVEEEETDRANNQNKKTTNFEEEEDDGGIKTRAKRTRTKETLLSEEFDEKDANLGKNIDLRSRGKNKSFLEQSRIIHDFQSNLEDKETIQDPSNILLVKGFESKKGNSYDDSVLHSSPTKKPIGSKIQIENEFKLEVPQEKEIPLYIQSELINNIAPSLITEIHEDEKHEDEAPKQNEIEFDIKREPHFKSFLHRKNIQSQKFSSIFSKMRDTSKYSNLCSEFRSYLKNNKFIDVVDSYSTIKLNKNSLERVCIPQFRDIKIQSEAIDTEVKYNTILKDEDDSPISVNNKRILLFIFILVLIFVVAILIIFLTN